MRNGQRDQQRSFPSGLARRHEVKKKLENEYHLLEERKKKFEQEKMDFEREQEKVG